MLRYEADMKAKILKRFEGEIQTLDRELKHDLPKEIQRAREHGDLRENAEYQYAKEEQGFIEGRIIEIEGKLSNAQVIDVNQIPVSGKIIFGVTVELLNVDSEELVTYQIVGDDESDVKLNKLSVYSPIARGLIGKEVGDSTFVKTPSGEVEFEVRSVRHV